jgi:transposase InsO family protein/transposase
MSKKRVIVLAITHQGLTKKQAATKYGVTTRWINILLNRYREGGLESLEPKSRRPHNNPNTTASELVEAVKQMRYELETQGLDAGPLSIHWYLTQQGLNPPSAATIRRILVRANMIQPQPRKRPRSSYIRFEAEQPNETWQSDFTHWTLANGVDIEILNFLDDHSRFLLACQAFRPVTGHNVVGVFLDCVAEYGPPQSTLTDNGFVYTAKYRGGKNKFEYALADLGIHQKNGSPNHPQTQGKIERFHQTLKFWLAQQPRAKTINELQTQLDKFRTVYNTQRPHTSLNRKTPHHVYHDTIKATPVVGVLEEHYRVRYDRVDTTGKVTLRRAGAMHKLGIGRAYKGERVIVLVDQTTVTVTHKATGEVLGEYEIEPTRKYWSKTKNPT